MNRKNDGIRYVGLVFLLLIALTPTAVLGDPLDPNAFTSLGTLDVTTGTLNINTSTGMITGAATCTGTFQSQLGAEPIAVFDFDSINIGSEVSVVVSGTRPLAILSRANATIAATIALNTDAYLAGSGGSDGVYVNETTFTTSLAGNGLGAGDGGSGGGFGGTGGFGSSSLFTGGKPYGNILTSLVGGSSGGLYNNASGLVYTGGGGGAIEIGAVGNLSIGTVTANGGNAYVNGTYSSGGGGSGGAIILHANSILVTGVVSASGGNGASNYYNNGGGGGGRLAMLGIDTYTLGTSLSSFYAVWGGGGINAIFGQAGVITVGAKTTVVPSGRSVVLNGQPIISANGSTTTTGATYEAVINSNLTVNSGGSATLGASNVLRSNASLQIDGYFDVAGFSQTVAGLTGMGLLRVPSGSTFTVSNISATETFGGLVIGDGTLVVGGDSNHLVANFSSFIGQTNVLEYNTLALNNGFGFGPVNLMGSNSGLVLMCDTDNYMWGGVIGAGYVFKTGFNTLTLFGNNTYSGPTMVSAGTLKAGGNNAFGNGSAVTLDNTSGAGLDLDGRTVTIGSLGGGGADGGNVALGNGTLVVGSDNSSTAFAGAISGTGGLQKIGLGNLTLTGNNNYTGSTTISSGALQLDSALPIGTGQVRIESGGTLVANASVNRPIAGAAGGSAIVANTTSVSLGSATSYTGFSHAGTLEVGSNTVTLNSKGLASLGTLTNLGGGQISAPNGIALGAGSNVVGSGTVNARVAAYTGSAIYASGGNLSLGNASSPVGFACDGELYTDLNSITLNDSNQAVLGSLTQVGNGTGGSGTLNAANGYTVDFGRNLVGQGTVNSTNTLAKAAIINGSVQGDGSGLVLSGYVKGVGTYSGDVIFSGTYSPGLSPASVNLENMTLRPTSTLIIELGGRVAGSEYDVVNLSGAGSLDGTFNVSLLNGFRPVHNDQFTVMTFGSHAGDFSTKSGLDLGSRLVLVPQYTANSLVLTAVQGGSGVWRVDHDGGASASTNWNNGLPNGVGDTATFGSVITQPRTVTIDSPVTMGGMSFDGGHKYTIAGPADITLQQSDDDARIDVHNGNHEIAAALKLLSDTTIDVDSAELLISGSIDGNHRLTKTGSGRLNLTHANTYIGATTISAGTLALAGNGQISESSPIVNNATFLVADGIAAHAVGAITGTGSTLLDSGAALTATSVVQNTVTLGVGARLTIAPIAGGPTAGIDSLRAVPEPGMIVMLVTGAIAVLFVKRARRRKVGHGAE
jgi:autotransporter-associated beta strand protein